MPIRGSTCGSGYTWQPRLSFGVDLGITTTTEDCAEDGPSCELHPPLAPVWMAAAVEHHGETRQGLDLGQGSAPRARIGFQSLEQQRSAAVLFVDKTLQGSTKPLYRGLAKMINPPIFNLSKQL